LGLYPQVFEQNHCFLATPKSDFSPSRSQKCAVKKLSYNVSRVDVASVIRELSQKSRQKADISPAVLKKAIFSDTTSMRCRL